MEKRAYLISGGPSTDIMEMVEDLQFAFEASSNLHPRVAYVGTATHDNEQFFQFMREPLVKAGAAEVDLVPIAGEHSDVVHAKQLLINSDVVFLSGGEPEDGIRGLETAHLDTLLADLYQQGKTFIGISAGAIMMGKYWVHWDVKGDDSTARLIDCLGFSSMTFDAHGEAEDWKDLRCALTLMPSGSKGHGLVSEGFYRIDSEDRLISFRDEPVVLTATQ